MTKKRSSWIDLWARSARDSWPDVAGRAALFALLIPAAMVLNRAEEAYGSVDAVGAALWPTFLLAPVLIVPSLIAWSVDSGDSGSAEMREAAAMLRKLVLAASAVAACWGCYAPVHAAHHGFIAAALPVVLLVFWASAAAYTLRRQRL